MSHGDPTTAVRRYRTIATLLLLVVHGALQAQGLDFVKPLTAIQRAPITSDTMGRMMGTPGFAYLQRPVAVGAYGSIVYLFDAGPNLFYRFDRSQETLQELPRISGALKGTPASITVLPDRSFYVADPLGHQVIHASLDGQVLRILSDQANLASPIATAFDMSGNNLLVADGLFDHVVGFNQEGWLLFGFGQRGMGAEQFQLIVDMSEGPEGLYVVDRMNPFIKIYTPEGRFIYAFPRTEVSNPAAIAVDWRGRVYVADAFDDTIKVYVKERYVGEIGGTGSELGRFRFITDLDIDGNFLYVADSMNGRVQVFVIDPLGNEGLPPATREPAPVELPPLPADSGTATP